MVERRRVGLLSSLRIYCFVFRTMLSRTLVVKIKKNNDDMFCRCFVDDRFVLAIDPLFSKKVF